MSKRVILGCLLVLMLAPISFTVAESNEIDRLNTINDTIFKRYRIKNRIKP